MVPGTHGSTYGGNFSCAVALETTKHILKPRFLSEIRKKVIFLKEKLNSLIDIFPDQILEVRGRGLMLGLKCAIKTLSSSIFVGKKSCYWYQEHLIL